MKMKKLLAVLLAALMMLTLFAGCGDKGSDDSKKDGTVNSESADKDTEKKEPDNSGDTIDIRPGKVNGNTYTNTSVGITFTMPEDLEISNLNTPTDEDHFYEALTKGTVSELEFTSRLGGMLITFDDWIIAYPEFSTEEEFLSFYKDSVIEASEIYQKTLGEHTYYVIDTTSGIKQRIYLRKEDKYAIKITMMDLSGTGDFDSLEKLFS